MLDRTKYTEKSMVLLNTKRFKKITADSAAATERKIQKIFKKQNLNSQSRFTKHYTQQAQHQLDYTVQPKYTI